MTIPSELIDTVMELKEKARKRIRILRSQLDEAEQSERLWADLTTYLQKGWPQHILHCIKDAELLKQMRSISDPAIPKLEEMYRLAKEQAEKDMQRFPRHLEKAAKEAGLPIDNKPHPRYSFADGFLQLEIDDQKGLAHLTARESSLAQIPADVNAIVELVQKEYQRLFDRPFEGEKFLQKLRDQYVAVAAHMELQDGEAVPIRKITQRLGKRAKGFRIDEFLVDMSRLVERGPLEINGRRLDLQQTKSTSQGFLLLGAAARGYIGFVVFRKA